VTVFLLAFAVLAVVLPRASYLAWRRADRRAQAHTAKMLPKVQTDTSGAHILDAI
jgi:hypothetical protein